MAAATTARRRHPTTRQQLFAVLLSFILTDFPNVQAFSSDANSSPQQQQQPPPPVLLPTSQDGLVRQAASAIGSALTTGNIHLQSIRLPLSEAMYSQSEEGFVADRAIGWQGGPQETYRYLSPLVRQLLQSIETIPNTSNSGLLPKLREQVLLEFDGSAVLTSECPAGPRGDAQALLQPNTDAYYLKTIRALESQLSPSPSSDCNPRLLLLVNPAWRDAGSFGFFQAQQAQTEIFDRYTTTYAVDQFVIRGQKVSLIKVWPHDWCLFWSRMPHVAKNDHNQLEAKFLRSFSERPEYKVMDQIVHRAVLAEETLSKNR